MIRYEDYRDPRDDADVDYVLLVHDAGKPPLVFKCDGGFVYAQPVTSGFAWKLTWWLIL